MIWSWIACTAAKDPTPTATDLPTTPSTTDPTPTPTTDTASPDPASTGD